MEQYGENDVRMMDTGETEQKKRDVMRGVWRMHGHQNSLYYYDSSRALAIRGMMTDLSGKMKRIHGKGERNKKEELFPLN